MFIHKFFINTYLNFLINQKIMNILWNARASTGMRPGRCYFEVTSISADEPTLPVASYAFAWSLYTTLGFATTFQLYV